MSPGSAPAEVRRTLGIVRSLAIYWRPGWQRGLRRLYEPFVGPDDLVFDVGAHLGDRTAAFAALGARVVALEPQPELLPWLRRLVGRREGVTIRTEAVGRETGTARLAVSEANPTVSTLARDWRERIPRENPTFRDIRWERSVEVPVTTLDALIEEHGIPRFCKIDVEGYEAEVLAGLSHAVEAVSVEFVAGELEVALGCVERLDGLGRYRYNTIVGEGRRFALPEWVGSREISTWLKEGAAGASSGDLYARRVETRPRAEGTAERETSAERETPAEHV